MRKKRDVSEAMKARDEAIKARKEAMKAAKVLPFAFEDRTGGPVGFYEIISRDATKLSAWWDNFVLPLLKESGCISSHPIVSNGGMLTWYLVTGLHAFYSNIMQSDSKILIGKDKQLHTFAKHAIDLFIRVLLAIVPREIVQDELLEFLANSGPGLLGTETIKLDLNGKEINDV